MCRLPLCVWSRPKGQSSLVSFCLSGSLMYLNEATLLNNVRVRYSKDKIYVSVDASELYPTSWRHLVNRDAAAEPIKHLCYVHFLQTCCSHVFMSW